MDSVSDDKSLLDEAFSGLFHHKSRRVVVMNGETGEGLRAPTSAHLASPSS